MTMNTPPWRASLGEADPPGVTQTGPPSYDDGDDGNSVLAAAALVLGIGLVLVGALVLGLTVDYGGDGGNDVWKLKAKLVGLSGFSPFGGGITGGAMLIGAALLGALRLAWAARNSRRSSLVPAVTIAAGAAAGYLALLTLLNIVVDFTFLSDTESDEVGAVIGTLLGDAGAFVVLASALWWSMARQRR